MDHYSPFPGTVIIAHPKNKRLYYNYSYCYFPFENGIDRDRFSRTFSFKLLMIFKLRISSFLWNHSIFKNN